jgi:hypothetical protein
MCRSVLLSIVAIAFGAAAIVLVFLAQHEEPVRGLIAVEETHNFGELPQGEKVACKFELDNRFEERLAIQGVIKQCGCLKAECSHQELAPSERMSLQAEWETGARRGLSSQTITVVGTLPDGSMTATKLLMTATIVPDIVYEPEELKFAPDSPTQMVTFTPGRMKEFTLKRAYCTHRAFAVRLLADGVHVDVAYNADALLEDVPLSYLMVETTSPNEPVCHIPLIAERRVMVRKK